MNEELTGHLGYAKHDPACAGADNIRNGSRTKTVLTATTGHVEIDVRLASKTGLARPAT